MVTLPTGTFLLIGLAAALAAGIGALFALVVGRIERVEAPDLEVTRSVAEAPDEREADRAA